MRSIEQIIADNGGDNTPALDTHNLTGRVVLDPDNADMPLSYITNNDPGDENDYAPLATLDELDDMFDDEYRSMFAYGDDEWIIGYECG